ncbi:MAG TPA: DUF3857 domain-containing protein, partial [Acidobacteriota bacterium]|nr:DUF3857 domain-containing protein [Acidobacteriota bacterium]
MKKNTKTRRHEEKKSKFLVSLCLGVFFVCCSTLNASDYEILEKSDTADVESASYAREHHLVTVRILTIEGSDYREVIPVNSYIQVKNISVSIRYPDGRSERMHPEEIVELPLTMSPDMLTDFKAVVIAPKNLEPGCIVRIEYDRAITNLLYLNPWVYATSAPIKKAFYSIKYPSQVPIKYKGADASNLKMQKSDSEGRTTIMLGTSDQKEVTLIGGSENLSAVEKKVVFLPEYCLTDKWPLSTKNWQDIAQWFLELSKYAYHDDPGMDAVVSRIVAKYQDPASIAAALFDYIQNNYGYVAIEIGIGGYKPRFASLTFKKKYGDCKDLTLLYLTLLRKAGIEGFPALVDTRSAKFFDRDFPTPTQFNHCIAYLPSIRGGTWVDSTVKNFKFGEVPAVIQGKFALVAGPNTLLKIPEDFLHANLLRMQFAGALSENQLRMSGRVATEGQASTLVHSMQNAVMKNSIKHHVYQNLLLAGLPVQQLETELDGDRSLRL